MNPSNLFDLLAEGSGSEEGMHGGFLSQMFNGGSHMRSGRCRPRKGENSVDPLNVTLEDLYNGVVSKLQFKKKVICGVCNGRGGKEGAVKTCDQCRGSGRRFITRQIAPGMIQQMQVGCDLCKGEGEIINDKDRCRKCEGQKTIQQQKFIDVQVTPGMRDGQKIAFYGEGDQEPGIEPGDVYMIIKTKPHDTFERKGNDLYIRQKISLKEALCSYTTVIKHLDGRELALNSTPGDIIHPESVWGIIGEGMPIFESSERGNLYVIFDVDFPDNHFADEEDILKIEKLLPPRPPVTGQLSGASVEEVHLSPFEPSRYNYSAGSGHEAYHHDEEGMDSDEEGPRGHFAGGQPVKCAQQ